MPFELIDPAGLEAPVGYAHVAKITGGTVVHVAGQAPFNEKGEVVGKGDFVAQFTQVMNNLKKAIEAVGGRPNQPISSTMCTRSLKTWRAHGRPRRACSPPCSRPNG